MALVDYSEKQFNNGYQVGKEDGIKQGRTEVVEYLYTIWKNEGMENLHKELDRIHQKKNGKGNAKIRK